MKTLGKQRAADAMGGGVYCERSAGHKWSKSVCVGTQKRRGAGTEDGKGAKEEPGQLSQCVMV